jgi:predicted nucleic acid-binding protein
MGSLTCLTDPAALIAADTSAVINLNATGCAREILRAIPNKVMVVDVVLRELEEGRPRGRRDADSLQALVAAGLVEIGKLGDIAALHFERLVVGPAAMTLDDGEAATIAFAVARGAIAVVDERKATRLCAQMFPELCVGCTVDMLAHPKVQQGLGKPTLAEAVFKALYQGRMRVLPQHVEWVIGLIGPEKAAMCSSLPNSVRVPQQRLQQAGKRMK